MSMTCHQQMGLPHAAKQVHSINDLASAGLSKSASHLMGAISRHSVSMSIKPSQLCPGLCALSTEGLATCSKTLTWRLPACWKAPWTLWVPSVETL